MQIRQRKAGNSAGSTDALYHSPSGKRFRSRREALSELGLASSGGPSAAAGAAAGSVETGLQRPADELHAAAVALVEKRRLKLPLQTHYGVRVTRCALPLGRLQHPL
jgi:Methyl-CpG binding domain